MKKIILIFILICNSSVTAQNHKPHILDAVVEKYRKQYDTPAVVASVIKKDTIFYGIAGVKRSDKKEAISLESMFHLGSNTKAITSFIAAKWLRMVKLNGKLNCWMFCLN